MTSNFGISVSRSNKNLLLKLSGDFDSSSAMQLLSLMKNCINETEKIIIDTDSIGYMEPFGFSIFRYNLGSLARHRMKFVFTGEKASSLMEAWPGDNRPDYHATPESAFNRQSNGFGNELFY
jgi:anti-anti-sigma factor